MDGPVETVCGMVNDFEVSHELADLPPEVWQYLRDHRFFAMIIKKNMVALSFLLMHSLKFYKTRWRIRYSCYHCWCSKFIRPWRTATALWD